MNPVPVLIVAYRNGYALAKCINSINRAIYGTGTNCHPIVNDNSQDNIGYTRGMNQLLQRAAGFAYKKGQYAVLLNQDAQLEPDAIANAVAFMDAHPRCAIAGMKQLDPSDPDLITHGGTGAPFPGGEHLTGRVSKGDHAVSKPFLWVNGAAMIVRLEALPDIGLMDERFFNIGNDSDWCMTAWMNGWEVWYCADAVCLHGTHGCSHEPSHEQLQSNIKDMAEWGKKWSAIVQPATLQFDTPMKSVHWTNLSDDATPPMHAE